MGTTIGMTKDPCGPLALPVPRHLAQRLARALAAHPHHVGITMDDDRQFGTLALDADPWLALAVAVGVDGVTWDVIAYLCRAVRERRTVSFATNDDRMRRSGEAQAEVTLSYEEVDEPTLQWSSARAARALAAVGLAYDSRECLTVPAGVLAGLCRAELGLRPDGDVEGLLAVAIHAERAAGPQALVLAS